MSLTGGLDTRMIMAWQKSSPGTLPCYSFGGMFRDCHDVTLARRVAKVCGQPYQVIPIGKEFLARFAHYAERTIYLTDGCAGVIRSSDLYANERAAEIAPVRMTGNYGSEILRRLPAFKPVQPPPGLYRPEFVSQVQSAKETYSRLIKGHVVSFIAFRQAPWHHYGLFALENTQLSLRSPYLDNDLVKVAFRAPGAANAKNDIFEDNRDCVRLIADGSPALRRIRTDRGLAGPPGRMGGAISRGLMEFSFRAEYAYDYGMPPWLARLDHTFSWLHFERLFLGRHKFNHFRVWYRDALSGYVRDMLLDSRTLSRPFLNRSGVEAAVKGHLRGDQNHTTTIHQLLNLEILHRQFLDPR
jgi:asparagine synthase (glutamine-hydrolysing)